jgi:hypothetical protein
MEALQGSFKAFAGLVLHGLFFYFAGLRVAVELHLAGLGIDDTLDANGLPRFFFHHHGRFSRKMG